MSDHKVRTCSKKVEATHERKGKVIKNLATKESKTYKCINAAKRESLAIQKSNGGIGSGAVRVMG